MDKLQHNMGESAMQIYEKELQALLSQDFPWEKLSGRKIMLSGATGMIGKCIIDLLMQYNNNCEKNVSVSESSDSDKLIKIVALSRDEERARKRLKEHWDKVAFHYVPCDVNQEIPQCGQVDYIIHAASNTHPLQYSQDSIGTITANVIGTKNLLDYAVLHHAKRFCFVSSVEVYGENRGDADRFQENYLGYLDCNSFRAGYPESKRTGETLCNAYARTFQLDFVIPRLSRVYGPTMLKTDSKAISQFIKKAVAREDIVLKSTGAQLYSYTYALDAALGILTVLLRGRRGEAYNISDTESEVTLRQIAEWLAEDFDLNVVFEIPDVAEQVGYSTVTKALLDTRKISLLGWKPRTHIRNGLRKTVESFRQYDLL